MNFLLYFFIFFFLNIPFILLLNNRSHDSLHSNNFLGCFLEFTQKHLINLWIQKLLFHFMRNDNRWRSMKRIVSKEHLISQNLFLFQLHRIHVLPIFIVTGIRVERITWTDIFTFFISRLFIFVTSHGLPSFFDLIYLLNMDVARENDEHVVVEFEWHFGVELWKFGFSEYRVSLLADAVILSSVVRTYSLGEIFLA